MPSDLEFGGADPLRGGAQRDMKGQAIETDTRNIGRLRGGILKVPKYIVAKTSMEDVDANAEYWVLRVDSDPDARAALWYYANRVRKVNERLSDDLRQLLLQNGYREDVSDGAVLDGEVTITTMSAPPLTITARCGYCGKANGWHMPQCPGFKTVDEKKTILPPDDSIWGTP